MLHFLQGGESNLTIIQIPVFLVSSTFVLNLNIIVSIIKHFNLYFQVEAASRNPNDSAPPFVSIQSHPQEKNEKITESRVNKEKEEEATELCEQLNKEKEETTKPPKRKHKEKEETTEPPKRKHKRKGIPYRAPFF